VSVENLRSDFSHTILKDLPSELNDIGTCFDILDFMNIVFPKIACEQYAQPPFDAQAVGCPPSNTSGQKEIMRGGWL